MSITCFADEIAEEFQFNCQSADLLLRDIITKKNGKPEYSDSVFFQQKLNWDVKEINRQLHRISRVLRWQAIAGSPETREATAAESATAAAAFEKEDPKLAEQIQKLQAKRDALERDMRLSAKRCEGHRQAVQELRELPAKHIADKVNHALAEIANGIGQEIADTEIRINELQCCLDPSRYQNQAAYLDQLQRSFQPAVAVSVSNGVMKKTLSPEWPSIRVAIETELAELIARIEPMKAQRAELIEQAERPLAFYADPANWNK